MAQPAAEPAPKGAKARLTGILTQEVSIVDMAANLRRWVLIKRAGGEMTVKKAGEGTAPEPGAKADGDPADAGAMAMPAAAKQTIMDGLAQVLEKVQSIASAVSNAKIDDNVPVPDGIGEMLKESAAVMAGLVSQFAAGGAPAAADADKGAPADPAAQKALEATRKAELDAYTAMVTTVNAARDRMFAAMNTMSEDPAKGIAEIQAVGDMLAAAAAAASGGAGVEAAKAAPTITADLAKRLGELATLAKAGRKIAGERLKRLQAMRSSLDEVILELTGEEKTAEGAAPKPAAPTAKAAEPDAFAALFEKLDASIKGIGETVQKALATPSPEVQKQLTEQKTLTEKALKDLAALTREVPASNVASPTGGPVVKGAGVSWPDDMAADLSARRSQRAQTTGK
jgi:hypothetical protein